MALTQPSLIPQPWGSDGQVGNIPQDSSEFGKASWAKGFPTETAQPLTEGGIPPSYLDFQGVLNALSAHAVFMQSGAHYTWSNTLDYPVGCFVLGSDGKLYQSLQASGPGYSAGAKNPTTNAAYWQIANFSEYLKTSGGTVTGDLIAMRGVITKLANSKSEPGGGNNRSITFQDVNGTNLSFVRCSINDKGVLETAIHIEHNGSNDGKWMSLILHDDGRITKNDGTLIPVTTGTIIDFAGNGTPGSGYLLCNGAAVSRTTYADLFAIIGTTYGAGNDSTTFNLPDFTNRFAQGSTTAGAVMEAGLPNITGTQNMISCCVNTNLPNPGALFWGDTSTDNPLVQASSTQSYQIKFDASRSSSVYGNSDTVQPPALTVRKFIRY